jgi:uncharacterized membrane protein YoaK (UPF0700 family)
MTAHESAEPARGLRAGGLTAACLALVAGFVDAYGYLRLGVFGANMTGNTVIFAILLYRDAEHAYVPVVLILLFFAGSLLGRVVMERFDSAAGLYVEAGLLTIASFTPGYAGLDVISLAMGMQNTSLGSFAGVQANTSFLSGDYTKLGQAVADLVLRRGSEEGRRAISILLPLIASYAAGAVVSVLCARLSRALLLIVPIVVALAFAIKRKFFFTQPSRKIESE